MDKHQTKLGVIEAIKATGTSKSNHKIIDWTRGSRTPASMDRRIIQCGNSTAEKPCLTIVTFEGAQWVNPGNWIIKGIAGDFHSCTSHVFEQTYESVE